MATLRNLRNMLEAGVSGEHVEKDCALLANAKAVQKAKQLPFRFLAAYRDSPKSKVLSYDIGLLLGMLLHMKCRNVLSGMFGDTWKAIALPPGQALANVDEFYRREGEVEYATRPMGIWLLTI